MPKAATEDGEEVRRQEEARERGCRKKAVERLWLRRRRAGRGEEGREKSAAKKAGRRVGSEEVCGAGSAAKKAVRKKLPRECPQHPRTCRQPDRLARSAYQLIRRGRQHVRPRLISLCVSLEMMASGRSASFLPEGGRRAHVVAGPLSTRQADRRRAFTDARLDSGANALVFA